MSYLPLEQFKYAWAFRHGSLPAIPEQDKARIKVMNAERARVLWTTFISREADHPDFFTSHDWPGQDASWLETIDWESAWDDESQLPEEITSHLSWEDNTTVYFCLSDKHVIETQFGVFKNYWLHFLFMSDGALLIGKKRQQAVQFLSNGTAKIGQKGAL